MNFKDITINRACLDNVLDYILSHEEDDFTENPSINHVYFNAMVLKYDFKYAVEILEKTIKNLE